MLIFIPADLPKPKRGATISATTAGRTPLKMRSTTWLSLNWVKTIAIKYYNKGRENNSSTSKQTSFKPSLLLPTNIAVFKELVPEQIVLMLAYP